MFVPDYSILVLIKLLLIDIALKIYIDYFIIRIRLTIGNIYSPPLTNRCKI
jgi:hypothetical protein